MLLYRISHANLLRTVFAKGKSYVAEIAEELIDCFFLERGKKLIQLITAGSSYKRWEALSAQ